MYTYQREKAKVNKISHLMNFLSFITILCGILRAGVIEVAQGAGKRGTGNKGLIAFREFKNNNKTD